MALHFMAILGVSLYEPVYYTEGDFTTEHARQFVQTAVLEKYKVDMTNEEGKVTIFVTEKARELNYKDRKYNDKDVAIAERWLTKEKENVIIGNKKPGLKSEINNLFEGNEIKVKNVSIPDGQNEKEIWEIYNTIYKNIKPGDRIIFDITHGYRSIPTIALSVLNYAKSLKECKLCAIHYGAYEASVEENDGVFKKKYTPIFNMTPFNEIMEWTNAADVFIKYGNASQMRTMLDEKLEEISDEQKEDWEAIKQPVNCAEALSKTLQTGRGMKASALDDDDVKSKKSIKYAYTEFSKISIKKLGLNNEVQPIYNILLKAKDRYSIFAVQDGYKVGLAVVEWCIDNGMVQQGYTALEESIITYLCKRYNIDYSNYRLRTNVIKNAIVTLENYVRDSSNTCDKMDYFDQNFDRRNATSQNERERARQIYNNVPEELGGLFHDIREKRNDINHFGIDRNPNSYETLESNLKSYYEQMKEIIVQDR